MTITSSNVKAIGYILRGYAICGMMAGMLKTILALAVLTPINVFAREDCSVRVVKNVGAEEAPDSVLNRGATDYGPVTQVRVNKKTGRMTFCAHGSYCYASSAFAFTSPCRLSTSEYQDEDAFFFDAQ